MYVLRVDVYVKPEFIEEFRAATVENAQNSIREPGIVRFDLFQDNDDPTHFMLIEVYRSPEGHAAHRETAHYAKWRDTVGDWMAQTRVGTKYTNIFPDDNGWVK
jgi:quinol monooxygenase YgiN